MKLTALAARVNYSKGYLSKVEQGQKRPTPELARRCDIALRAEGALSALVPRRPAKAAPSAPHPSTGFSPDQGEDARTQQDSGEEVWLMRLSPDGESWFRPLGRRELMAAGAASIPALAGFRLGGPEAPGTEQQAAATLETSRDLLTHFRKVGQSTSGQLVLPSLIAQTHTLGALARKSTQRSRCELLRLSSRYAEYVGWLVQENGDDRAAMWWTQRAVDLAEAGGDHDLAAYALVRRALVTFYQQDGPRTVALTQRAQHAAPPPRIRALAAQQEAQGHALAGDYSACMRRLDEARTRFAAHTPNPDEPVIGTMNLPDPAEMITGWCLHDLGRPRQAADVIDQQLRRVSPDALRTRLRYGMRGALAYAAAGEIPHACELAEPLLKTAGALPSATVATDIRALARVLRRHPDQPSVRALRPLINAVLHPYAT